MRLLFWSGVLFGRSLCEAGHGPYRVGLFDQRSKSNEECRKDWQSATVGAVLTVNSGRPERSEILPCRLRCRCGASVVRRRPRTEWRISISKSAKKRAARLLRVSRSAGKPAPKTAQSKGPRHIPPNQTRLRLKADRQKILCAISRPHRNLARSRRASSLCFARLTAQRLRRLCKLRAGSGTQSAVFWRG
jgi:hypothetical protein